MEHKQNDDNILAKVRFKNLSTRTGENNTATSTATVIN